MCARSQFPTNEFVQKQNKYRHNLFILCSFNLPPSTLLNNKQKTKLHTFLSILLMYEKFHRKISSLIFNVCPFFFSSSQQTSIPSTSDYKTDNWQNEKPNTKSNHEPQTIENIKIQQKKKKLNLPIDVPNHPTYPAVNHYNAKRVWRNWIHSMWDVVTQTTAIMIEHSHWKIYPNEVYNSQHFCFFFCLSFFLFFQKYTLPNWRHFDSASNWSSWFYILFYTTFLSFVFSSNISTASLQFTFL